MNKFAFTAFMVARMTVFIVLVVTGSVLLFNHHTLSGGGCLVAGIFMGLAGFEPKDKDD